jgi:hypothetical protein
MLINVDPQGKNPASPKPSVLQLIAKIFTKLDAYQPYEHWLLNALSTGKYYLDGGFSAIKPIRHQANPNLWSAANNPTAPLELKV